MKTKITVIVLALTTFFACKQQPKETADTIYTNGKIYTVNETQPWAEAVAIKDGKFMKVGTTGEIEVLKGENTKVVDLKGAFAMPGVFDLHAHPFITPWYGDMNLQLVGADSKEKILDMVKKYAIENPDKEWIIGGQWLLGILYIWLL